MHMAGAPYLAFADSSASTDGKQTDGQDNNG
jgi:hypothetical protein